MIEKLKAMMEAAKHDRKTSVCGVIAVALYGAGETMRSNAIEPWGSVVIGLAGLMTLLVMFWAKDRKPEDPKS